MQLQDGFRSVLSDRLVCRDHHSLRLRNRTVRPFQTAFATSLLLAKVDVRRGVVMGVDQLVERLLDGLVASLQARDFLLGLFL